MVWTVASRSISLACLLITGLLLATPVTASGSGGCGGTHADLTALEICANGHGSCDTGYGDVGTSGQFFACVQGAYDERQESDCNTGYAAVASALGICGAGYGSDDGPFDPARSCDAGAVAQQSVYVCAVSDGGSGCTLGYLDGSPGTACVMADPSSGCQVGFVEGILGTVCVLPDTPV